eukprot:Em0162g18a
MASGKLDTPHFQKLKTDDLLRLETLFRDRGYEFRLVGGVVRDLLLGKVPKDVDIATDCTPDVMTKMFEERGIRYIETGLKHGTVTVHFDTGDYEITTLRVDKATDGRHAEVEFIRDWKTDALRRDLTINSMSLTLDGVLHDYFDGQRHLAEKKILFVGDARTRIREDYLRILRYFRFYGRIVPEPDRHDVATLEAIEEMVNGLKGISVERVLKVAQTIGLPDPGWLEELEKVWKSMTDGCYQLKPVSLLVALVPTVDKTYRLAEAWKLSNSEKGLGVFLVQHRTVAYYLDTSFKYFQDLVVDSTPLATVQELAYYCGRVEYAIRLSQWTVPSFISCEWYGAFCPQVSKKDPSWKALLGYLRQQWKESNFGLNRTELLALANSIRVLKSVFN